MERRFKKMVKFLRRECRRYSKFGNAIGKKAKWRKPTGRHNKLREKKRGYGAVVSIGYSTDKKVRGLLNEKEPVVINNVADLQNVGEGQIGFVARVGQKKKIEIAKKAKELKIELKNINVDSFLKSLKTKEKKE